MTTISINGARQWLKTSQHPVARYGFGLCLQLRHFELPAPRIFYGAIYYLHQLVTMALSVSVRIFYWTPLFKSRVTHAGKNLYLFGGMPYLSGPLEIRYGNNCRISGHTTFSGRAASPSVPQLTIGDNVDVGWQSVIAVGSRVLIGNNVRLAGKVFIAGYPGHPIDAADRAAGLPDLDHQAGDIIIEDDVWIATGVTIMPHVRIGKRSIIASGSIVTADIPADTLAGGVPAKTIKSLIKAEQ